jgi:hypothetical protein
MTRACGCKEGVLAGVIGGAASVCEPACLGVAADVLLAERALFALLFVFFAGSPFGLFSVIVEYHSTQHAYTFLATFMLGVAARYRQLVYPQAKLKGFLNITLMLARLLCYHHG